MPLKPGLFRTQDVMPTKPSFITVSSIRNCQKCPRFFYWRNIRNITSNYLHLPFYTGGMVHKGIELFYRGLEPGTVLGNIAKEIEKVSKSAELRPQDIEMKSTQDAIITGGLAAYMKRHASEQEEWKLVYAEQAFRMRIDGLKLKFRGVADLIFERINKKGKRVLSLGEHKCQASIPETMKQGLHQNLQVQLYPVLFETCTNRPMHEVIFNVIMKPKIRQKNNERFDEFVERIEDQYVEKEDEMFWRNKHVYKEKYMRDAVETLQIMAEDIERRLHDVGDKYLQASSWPKHTERCFDYYSKCTYFELCKGGEYPQNTAFLGKSVEYATGTCIDEPDLERKKNATKKIWKETKPKQRA